MNLWNFSSKNGYPTPLKVSGFGNLIRSKTALHKFGQHFYNGKTVDHALSDPTMARLLAYWINAKFSLFRNKDLSDGLREATKLPLGEDGRKLCLKILSRPGCQFTNCSIAHFRPESLAEGVQNLISERPSCEQEERERYKIVMATLNKSRVFNQASVYENYQKNAVGLSPPPLRPNLIDDVDADQVQFWSTFAEPNKWSLSDVPAGAVDKAAAATVDIRLINDYSIPPVHSINDFTDHESLPSISYNPPRDTANRIHFIASSHLVEHVLMMIGDVSGAFRHISIHADSVHMFAFVFEDLLVVDLSCGFGWCGSPAFYTLVGSIINALYEHGNKLTRQFHGNVWCDDHTCIEVDRGSACFNANLSLRWAMATDTSAGTVSIPVDKLTKASDRVDDLVSSKFATRTIQLQVIGSFRHVASSFPPARAFLQCLQETATACPKYGRRVLSASTLDDLRWFQAVLRHPARFNAIPIIHFADMSESRFHVFTDASGDGLYVLEPTLKRYIHQRFSTEDLTDTSIHVRELRSAVLAALHWGPYRASESNTTRTHVQFHIDNTNAVAWANHRSSRHSVVKMHNRLLSLVEFQYNLVFTASHIADKLNMMADAGSRLLGSLRSQNDLANSTTTTYTRHWGQWCRFATRMNWMRWLTPENASKRLAYYATYCWIGGWNSHHIRNQHSTIKLKLASICWFHRRYKNLVLRTSPKLDLVLQGIKRLSAPRHKKQPLTPPFLRTLYLSLDMSKPRQHLLWGSVIIGYFFLLRRTEFLKTGKTRRLFGLKTINAFFSDDNGKRVARNAATSVTIVSKEQRTTSSAAVPGER
ncbi:hypothetical protein F442_14066 [Phytophthora nicotianae P10297]|uniref:Uncharacterized protein n=1 Tax=Phytophthora nicotianae P10297 TaxID=1317064 RepID=W2YWG3_PHYNI|nr:hypothetical protein F442_14066 [Phytophthora nicotianae P10297]